MTFHFGGDPEAAAKAAAIAAKSPHGLAYDGHQLLSSYDDFKDMLLTVFVSPADTSVTAADADKADIRLQQYFDFDEARLRREYLPALEKAAGILRSDPNAVAMIVGHTDSIGPADYNLNLGRARATSVREWLRGLGIASDRIYIKSKGEAEPAGRQ